MNRLMKWATALLFCALLVCCWAIPCDAQTCYDSLQSQTVHCVFKPCSNNVTVGVPQGEDGDNFTVSCSSTKCCGQLVTNCHIDEDCDSDQLRGPTLRKRVSDLATTSRILVADCKGHYAPFRNRLRTALDSDSFFASDHLLR